MLVYRRAPAGRVLNSTKLSKSNSTKVNELERPIASTLEGSILSEYFSQSQTQKKDNLTWSNVHWSWPVILRFVYANEPFAFLLLDR